MTYALTIWQPWCSAIVSGPKDASAQADFKEVSPVAQRVLHLCGDCKLRGDGTGKDRACYTHTGMVNTISEHHYEVLDDSKEEVLKRAMAGRGLRLGSFGDPAAVPTEVLKRLVALSAGAIGYTHQWRRCDPELKYLVMASVDTPKEAMEAWALGWRTFRTRFSSEMLFEREISCPASAEAGKRTTCDDCRLCDGVQYSTDPRANIAIVPHGWSPALAGYRRAREGLRVMQ